MTHYDNNLTRKANLHPSRCRMLNTDQTTHNNND